MSYRTLLFVAAIGLVTLSGLVLFTTYPFAYDTAESPFTTGETSAYETTGSLYLDDKPFVTYESAVTVDGTAHIWYQTRDNVTVELYEREGNVYGNLTAPANEREMVDQFVERYDGEVLSQNEVDGRVATIFRATNSSRSVEAESENWNDLIVTNLGYVNYEQIDDTDTYHAQNSWYKTSRAYRVTDTRGTVHADPQTGSVSHANIEFTRTVASSPLEYLLNRNDAIETEITYEMETENVEVDTPEWVNTTRSTEST